MGGVFLSIPLDAENLCDEWNAQMTERPSLTLLPNRRLLSITGADARRFLDALVTADLSDLAPGKGVHAALLSPQGKILSDFFVLDAGEADGPPMLLLDCPLVKAEDLGKRLHLYKLRAAIEISLLGPEVAVFALYGADAAAQLAALDLAIADPRQAGMGLRIIGNRTDARALLEETGAKEASFETYQMHRVAQGQAECGFDFQPGDVFPHEINMDQLGGVSFTKGCYVGQEVVSRMQHRGTARTRLVPFSEVEGATIESGAPIMAGDITIGTTCSQGYARNLGMVRLDRVTEALKAGKAILAGNAEIRFVKPDWWKTRWITDFTENKA
jgi:tRNA-modifying protein YgfZ